VDPSAAPSPIDDSPAFPVGQPLMPRPLDVEVPRLRLVQRLGQRWERPVTLVVAGPGFGKTTVLAQAVRSHLLAPRGVDVWVNCEAAHEDAVLLARTLLTALSIEDAENSLPGVRDVVNALIRLAPIEVCLLLDDVHEIPAGSPGTVLLSGIVRALPATAHIVLCGREVPDLPLARHEAAGELVRIGADELSFSDIEVRSLGRRLDREPTLARSLRGWPALVRLAFAAGPSAPWRYAREEILGRLTASQRRALAALAALDTATAAEIAEVTGEPVALDDLAKTIPLVVVLDDGRYRAHELWTEALARTMPVEETQHLHRSAAAILAARGDLVRAGALACRTRDWVLLAGLAVELVNTTLSALPRAIAERWLQAIPSPVAEEPEFVLLRAAVIHAVDFADPRIDALLDRAWYGLHDTTSAPTVLAQAVITAHSRADLARLADLARRADELRAYPSVMVQALCHSVAATLAEVGGDPEAALAEIVQAPVLEVPAAIALPAVRFHYHCLDMCGFGGEAADLADRTVRDTDDEHVRLAPALARWFDGDPSDLDRLRATGSVIGTARDAFVTSAFLAVVASCRGDGPLWPVRPCGDPDSHGNARDAALACAAHAAVSVSAGDESAAGQAYARHLSRWPIEVPFNERHLRRFLALGYVLSEDLRTRWDNVELGPSHRRARAAARALLAARAGVLAPAARLPLAHALCFLPLPWSVELAARLTAVDRHRGLNLGRWLADTVGPAAHQQLRTAGRSADQTLAASAAQLRAELPEPPTHRIGIEVIGAMRVTLDGVPLDTPHLRRARVRQLLGALVLRPVLTRDEVTELLWPGLDPSSAARNLRVTLTHLRCLLEPGRTGGDANFHLRTDGGTIRLVRSTWLTADLWTADLLDRQATRARTAGDIERAKDLLAAVAELWRGDPLADLRALADPELMVEIDRVRAQHVRTLLDLGELRLVSGETIEAAGLARRALAVDPYDPRGHRLALAAALKSRDPARIAAAREHVLVALGQLGAPPDPATGLLLRQTSPPRGPGSARGRPPGRLSS
jgi:LuxR family maltose regulon positive regulatory protein